MVRLIRWIVVLIVYSNKPIPDSGYPVLFEGLTAGAVRSAHVIVSGLPIATSFSLRSPDRSVYMDYMTVFKLIGEAGTRSKGATIV